MMSAETAPPEAVCSEPQVSVLVSLQSLAEQSPKDALRGLICLLHNLAEQSLAAQLEVLLLDRLSGETETELQQAFQQKFQRLVMLPGPGPENKAVALNRGLQTARGKYLTLADPQQRHAPDAYACLLTWLEARPEAALAYADIALTPHPAELLLPQAFGLARISAFYRWPEFDPVSFFQQGYAGPQPMWRRDLHRVYGSFDPEFAFAWDTEFWLRLLASGEYFVHLPAVLGLILDPGPSGLLALAETLRCRQRYWQSSWGVFPVGESPPDPRLVGYVQGESARYPSAERLSVLLWVAEHPERLPETLWTVMAQHYPELELLLINASQTDLSGLLAQIPGLPKTLVLEAQGLEARQLRNCALRLATGQFVFGLNCGDRWHGNHLLRHLEALQTHAFVYSEAWRMPQPQASAFQERRTFDRNNTADLSRDGLSGQFLARAATSYHRSLLASLPLDAASIHSDVDLAHWQETEVYRRNGLFGAATWNYPDWDWQWLALQQVEPHRLDQVTCEVAGSSGQVRQHQMPNQPLVLPAAQRLQACVAGLAQPPLPPELPKLALVFLFVPVLLPADLAGFEAVLPEPRPPLVLLGQPGASVSQRLPSDLLCLDPLGYQPGLTEQLRQSVALAPARTIAVIIAPDGLAGLKQLPLLDNAVTAEPLIQAWSKDCWQPLQARHLAELGPEFKLLFARACDWREWLA